MSRSHSLYLALVALIALAVAPAYGTVTAVGHGLWLLPRKDCCNTARADVAGDMKTAPREVWSYGASSTYYAFLKPVRIGKNPMYFAQVRSGLRLVRPNGSVVWKRSVMNVGTVVDVVGSDGGKPVALVTIGIRRFCLVDVATGKTLWAWQTPTGSFLGGYRLLREHARSRLIVFPQNSVLGFCFEISSKPSLIWQHDYTGKYWQGYGPFFVLADMDNDRSPEIVLAGKPGYAAVIDVTNGNIKCDLSYEITSGDHLGRPYGLITARDIDGDGYRDIVVVSCQVEEYVSVIHNNAGKSLSLMWSHFVGLDYPTEPVKLRPNTTSVADVNGDGNRELVTGVFNETGDGRWHTLVINACKGWNSRLADLPDRYLWGCYDLDGNHRPEILTSIEKSAIVTGPTNLQVVSGETFQNTAATTRVALSPAATKLPLDTAYQANVVTPSYVTAAGVSGILVSRGKNDYVWRVSNGKSAFTPVRMTELARTALASEGSGKVGRGDLSLGRASAAPPVAASWPLVSQSHGKPELVLQRSDGTVVGGKADLKRSGKFNGSWAVRGTMPSCWIGPDGKRLLCAADPDDNIVRVYEPSHGADAKLICQFRTPMPINRSVLSRSTAELLPFGDTEMHLYVGLRPGVHAIAGAMYDSNGNMVWQDKQNGPYPRVAAAADLAGDGAYKLIVDNHGRHLIYDQQGKGRTVAVGWGSEIPGRADGAKYAVPIVGPFGPADEMRIVMSGGLDALETLDAAGNRISKCNTASCYDFQWCGAAVAKIRNTKDWDVGTINCYGVFYCSDVNTCATRWTLDLGVQPINCANISSGDVDGDGRDNFIVGLPDGRLVALDERDGKGFVLWQMAFDAGVEEAFLADVDGDGKGEIIVDLDDGQVKILKAGQK